MNNAVINFNTDPKVKRELIETANEMGLTLSSILNKLSKDFLNDKRIEFRGLEIPNTRTIKAIKDADREYKEGKTAGPFSTVKAMRESLGV
jgi:RelB antitoxin.